MPSVKIFWLKFHPMIRKDADTRFSMALGESFADWIRKRFGALPPVPDGVAFPESGIEVRDLLNLAQNNNWVVIPYAGGTSVSGHLDCPMSERPVLSINLSKLNRLRNLNATSQLATFEAGTIKHPIAYETYVDETFARRARAAQIAI